MATPCPRCGAALPPDAPEGLCPACLLAAGLDETQPHLPEPERAQYLETLLNRRLPDYKLRHLIGRGGMGEVWLAEQPSLGRQVAIKVLPAAVSADAAFAERFHREARAMAQLDHPNIVHIFDYGSIGDLFFIIMEYLPLNLRQQNFCRGIDGRHPIFNAFFRLCDAVAHAHARGIIHRDLKPENILAAPCSVHVKLADFGLARLRDAAESLPAGSPGSGDPRLTQTHQALGTPRYMAPEQRDRPQQVDQRADIYALGLILHEMLTGTLPGAAPQTGYPALDAAIRRATDPNPDCRFSNVVYFKATVEQIYHATLPANLFSDVGYCLWLLFGLIAIWHRPVEQLLGVAEPADVARLDGLWTWPAQLFFFGPVLLTGRVWWSLRLEKLAVGAALVSLLACTAYAHFWQPQIWPAPVWWLYVLFAMVFACLLIEKLHPFGAWALWSSGRTIDRHGRLYAACALAPAVLVIGCLLFGALAPAAWRHWMDVALLALLAAPRLLAARAARLRERLPYHLFGWGGDLGNPGA